MNALDVRISAITGAWPIDTEHEVALDSAVRAAASDGAHALSAWEQMQELVRTAVGGDEALKRWCTHACTEGGWITDLHTGRAGAGEPTWVGWLTHEAERQIRRPAGDGPGCDAPQAIDVYAERVRRRGVQCVVTVGVEGRWNPLWRQSTEHRCVSVWVQAPGTRLPIVVIQCEQGDSLTLMPGGTGENTGEATPQGIDPEAEWGRYACVATPAQAVLQRICEALDASEGKRSQAAQMALL